MAKRSTMTAEEAVRAIGIAPGLGLLRVTSENRGLVRKWLAAMGVPRRVADFMPMASLQGAYNDAKELDALWAKVPLYEDEGEVEEAEADEKEEATPLTMSFKPGSIERAIEELVKGTAQKAVDADTVRGIVKEELAAQEPKRVEIKVGERKVLIKAPYHPVVDTLVALAELNDPTINVYLTGPAGCGKSTVCGQAAEILGRRSVTVSASGGVTEAAFTGYLLPGDGMRMEHRATEFLEAYEGGNAIILLDEGDGMDENTALSLNSATSNGHMHVPHRLDKPVVTRGDKTMIIAAGNTMMTGGDHTYSGRNAQDGAFRDRFLFIEMDYHRPLEQAIAESYGLDVSFLTRFWALRDAVRKHGLRRIVSTRGIQKVGALTKIGKPVDEAFKQLTVGWSADEKQRCGI